MVPTPLLIHKSFLTIIIFSKLFYSQQANAFSLLKIEGGVAHKALRECTLAPAAHHFSAGSAPRSLQTQFGIAGWTHPNQARLEKHFV